MNYIKRITTRTTCYAINYIAGNCGVCSGKHEICYLNDDNRQEIDLQQTEVKTGEYESLATIINILDERDNIKGLSNIEFNKTLIIAMVKYNLLSVEQQIHICMFDFIELVKNEIAKPKTELFCQSHCENCCHN